jgi:hypothetical protein
MQGLLFCAAFMVIGFFSREQPENTHVLKKRIGWFARRAKRRGLLNCPRERPPDMKPGGLITSGLVFLIWIFLQRP